MSWLFSQALVEESLAAHYLAGEPFAPSSATHTPLRSWLRGKTTGHYHLFLSGMTLQPLTGDRGEAVLTSFLAGFPARTFPLQAQAEASKVHAQGFGESLHGSFATFDRSTSSWRTAQPSLLGDSTLYSGTWPRSGTMRNGVCWERTMPVLRIAENESGLSGAWPTPTVSGNNNRHGATRKAGDGLASRVRATMYPTPCTLDSGSRFNTSLHEGAKPRPTLGAMAQYDLWPTPTVQDAKNNAGPSQMRRNTFPLNAAVGGALNPTWVEWLMGWPLGWTALDALATDRFRSWQRSHGLF
jgi:hypothetical protein